MQTAKEVLPKSDSDDRVRRFAFLQLIQFLADAKCARCGHRLGDDFSQIVQNDQNETVHKSCK